MQSKKSDLAANAASQTQANLSRAIKEIEEELAYGKRKAMTGLQKWQLAVKYLAMHQDRKDFNFLDRYQNQG